MSKPLPKNERISIYRKRNVKWRNSNGEGTFLEKHYLNSKGQKFWASVRQVVAQQNVTQDATYDSNTFLVTINKKDLPEGVYYVEWKKMVMKVMQIDIYDGKSDVKLTCQHIDSDSSSYSRITYGGSL